MSHELSGLVACVLGLSFAWMLVLGRTAQHMHVPAWMLRVQLPAPVWLLSTLMRQ
jgi:hypothetical protein